MTQYAASPSETLTIQVEQPNGLPTGVQGPPAPPTPPPVPPVTPSTPPPPAHGFHVSESTIYTVIGVGVIGGFVGWAVYKTLKAKPPEQKEKPTEEVVEEKPVKSKFKGFAKVTPKPVEPLSKSGKPKPGEIVEELEIPEDEVEPGDEIVEEEELPVQSNRRRH